MKSFLPRLTRLDVYPIWSPSIHNSTYTWTLPLQAAACRPSNFISSFSPCPNTSPHVTSTLLQEIHLQKSIKRRLIQLNLSCWSLSTIMHALIIQFTLLVWNYLQTRSYTADAVLYRQPSGQPTNTVMLNLNWLRVEEVSWQWSVGRVTVPRLSTWYDVTWYDMTWHDGARCDMTWHDVTWHDVTLRDMTWRDMACHDVTWGTWRDMTWHDVKWRDIMRHNATWRDMTRRYATWPDMTCDPYLNATRMNSNACEMAEILSKNY